MRHNKCTRELLIKHYETYPKLQIQDIFKFLYQSSFGCEHLISSADTVTEYIRREYETIHPDHPPVIEQLDGAYSRVPLSYLNNGLRIETLGNLFYHSARKEANGKSALLQKLATVRELIAERQLPFQMQAFEEAVKNWEAAGYPAVHHSDAFREAYKPSYRVIADRYIPLLPLLTELDKRLAKGNVKVAIEGGSASGKTTLSNILADIYDCTVFHMDDFFLRPKQRTPERFAEVGGNVDRERFLEEVLLPLNKGDIVQYSQFDCSTMSLKDKVQVTPKKLVIIEGAYSMHPDLVKYYDFSVFLDISSALQRERIKKRNTPALANRFFEEWIPLEKKYFSTMQIKETCDMQISVT